MENLFRPTKGWKQRTDEGVLRSSGKKVLPPPTTVSYTAAQFSPGFVGSVSTTKNAARIYGRAGRTLWVGVITGTEAKLTANSDFGTGGLPNLVEVSVDGGAFAAAPNVSTLFTLFTGLAHGPHLVQIRFSTGSGDSGYIASSGNVLSVTGRPPSITPVSNWVQAPTSASGSFVVNAANYAPKLLASQDTTNGSNVSSMRIRGTFNSLTVLTGSNTNVIAVSKNGAAPQQYSVAAEASKALRAITVPCDGSDSTYTVWNNGVTKSGGNHMAVSGDSAALSAGALKRLDQYGDSITYGTGPGATPIDVETMQVAAALGMVGGTNGVGGHTIAQCKALLDVVLPLKTITSNDVAVLTIGRNNAPGIDAAEQADYGLCIDKLVAAGYGKILCRAILPTPDGSSLWTTENAALQSVVTGKANPNVIWVPTSTWLGYGSQDNVHPTAAGYATLASFAQPAYASALGL